MRIMVTGGAGFIASHVAQACVEIGHEVLVLDNLSSGKKENVLNTLFRTLRDLSGSRQEEIHGPAMPGEQRRSVIENRMAFDELGWYPVISLDEGLALTLAYFRDKVKSSGTR
jgi:UDP-glucose 4-epimerase